MKTIFFALLFCLTLSACKRTPVEPEENLPIMYTGKGKNEWGNQYYQFVAHRDMIDKSLSFSGYGTDSPLYEFRVKYGNEWKEVKYGWCGTGLESYSVADMPEKFYFRIYSDEMEGKPWQLGIPFHKFVDEQYTSTTVWSNTVQE